jgi:hypothetical protein
VAFQEWFSQPFLHFSQPAPHGPVPHFQGFGRRIDGPLLLNGFQDAHLSFPENGISGVTFDPDLDPQFFMCVSHIRGDNTLSGQVSRKKLQALYPTEQV